MDLDDYQANALRTAGHGREPTLRLAVAGMGLSGEAAEVLEVVREAPVKIPCDLTWTSRLVKELGDVMWYVAETATACDIRLSDVVLTGEPTTSRLDDTARLVVHAGALTDYLKKVVGHGHPLDKRRVQDLLGMILRDVEVVAQSAEETLAEVLTQNVNKLSARYPGGFNPRDSLLRPAG